MNVILFIIPVTQLELAQKIGLNSADRVFDVIPLCNAAHNQLYVIPIGRKTHPYSSLLLEKFFDTIFIVSYSNF